jgi:NitT/TauT family transport system substrate-binding protein
MLPACPDVALDHFKGEIDMAKKIQSIAVRPHAGRRRALHALGGIVLAASALPRMARAQAAPKIRIGYWPIAAGLPFYAALEKGFFKEAGVDVEGIKFAGPPQIVEGMIAGRVDGTANGTASAALAIGELASPGLLKIIVSNPSNVQHVLDEFIVADKSAFKAIADLKGGKRVASGPGIQNVTLAKAVLEKAGVADATVIELPIGQHVAAVAAGQVEAAYTLEPTGTVGRLQGVTRVLEAGVISKYVLGDPNAPWFGGSASLASAFIAKYPDATAKYIAGYLRGVEFIRKSPAEARAFLKGYTAIEGSLTAEVPLAAYTTYREFTASDIGYFQKFFDLFMERKIFSARVLVASMIYKA